MTTDNKNGWGLILCWDAALSWTGSWLLAEGLLAIDLNYWRISPHSYTTAGYALQPH